MSGHTPEEWGVWPEINTFNVDGKMITGNTTGAHIAHVRSCGGEGERYAHLMSAAPELLEALKEALVYVKGRYECAFPDEQENESVEARVIAAIAKAEPKAKGERNV